LALIVKFSFVYILTNKYNRVLDTGVTNNIIRRVLEHRSGKDRSFTKKYNVTKLVCYEIYGESFLAIQREKQIKAGSRSKKIALINKLNPGWNDLFAQLCDDE
jgi:putative endonuclease